MKFRRTIPVTWGTRMTTYSSKITLQKLLLIGSIYRYSLSSSILTAFMSHLILNEWLYPFIKIQHPSLGARFVFSIQPGNRLQCHFTQSYICKERVCLAVTCHLLLWQFDRDLLRATAVTLGWNGYRNESQHRKLTSMEIKYCLYRRGLRTYTFQSQ